MANQPKFPPWLFIAIAAAVVGVLLYAFSHRSGLDERAPAAATLSQNPLPRPATTYLPSRASLPGQPAVQPMAVPIVTNPAERSPIADKLNLPENDVSFDLTIVRNLLDEYRRAYGAYPVGEDNPQILNALSGSNPKRLVFIARNHSALSPQGALLDRWGTPFFFHFRSSQDVEIRSAGPDREFYTSDDLVRPAH